MTEIISIDAFKEKIFNFEKHKDWVFTGEKPLIVNFFATWCGPCHMFAPLLEEASEKYIDQLSIYKIDIDQSPELAALFGIRSVPTTLFIKAGEEPALASGVISSESLDRGIHQLLGVH